MTVVYPMKLDDEIMPIIELKSKEEHTNKSVVLKQFIYKGLEEYVLELCSKGRISTGKAAEILGTTIYDIQRIAINKGIKLSATLEQMKKSKAVLNNLAYKKSS